MTKKSQTKKKTTKGDREDKTAPGAEMSAKSSKLTNKVYERELFKLQLELVKLQEWIKHKGLKAIIIFEGRDAAGKGGVIKRINQHLNPRISRVVALPAPTERETTQWYFQRYVAHLPAGHPIDLQCGVRYGLVAKPAAADEIGEPALRKMARPPAALAAKMQRLQAGIRRWQRDGRNPTEIGKLMKPFGTLIEQGRFDEAESLIDKAMKVLEK